MRKAVLKQNNSWAPITLLISQIIAQLSVIPMILFAEAWQWIPFVVVYCGMMLGITMGYHRFYSHRSYKCPKPIEYILLFFAHIMMVGPAITWSANHREHHKYADTPDDPHSPYYRGVMLAYFGQVLIDINFKFVRDLLRSNLHRNQVKYYWHVIAVWAGVLYLIDPMAILYAWLAPAGAAKLIGSLVFTFSHRGRKAHSDTWVGLITLGEGFHDVHHETRNVVWHKFDLGGQLIRLIDKEVTQ
jgi:stearoyl-CoA desaturase (delta-9 desaturase)